jgi:hypothetical protein
VQDVAVALGTLLRKKVEAVAAPVEAAEKGLKDAGVPAPMAALYAEMYSAFAKGQVGWENPAGLTRGTTSLVDALRPLVG